MYILMVRLKVKKDRIDDFIKASIGDGDGSVRNEPGCRRFDVIQDAQDPTLFAFTEVYNDEAAFEHHKTTSHFKKWDAAVKDLFDGKTEVSFCRPVFPRGDAKWDSLRPDGAVNDPYFGNSSLHVIHAPQYVQADKVDQFIDAVALDGVGSTHEEPGCLRFDVYQNIKDPTELYLYEVYANPAAFDYHRGTPHITKWRNTVKDWYDTSRQGQGRRVGKNVWPPDNWGWSSGKPAN
jgi:autoinducer 2-degrading protein